MAWSGGKDAALALQRIFEAGEFEVKALLTTLHGVHHRISMHGVREELLEQQAERIGIPLHKVHAKKGSNEEYEERMGEALEAFRDQGVRHVVFGDIFQRERPGSVFTIWNCYPSIPIPRRILKFVGRSTC